MLKKVFKYQSSILKSYLDAYLKGSPAHFITINLFQTLEKKFEVAYSRRTCLFMSIFMEQRHIMEMRTLTQKYAQNVASHSLMKRCDSK